MSLPHVFGPLTGQVPLSYLDDDFNYLIMLVSTTVAPVGTNDFLLALSGGSLTLQPINGNNVDINGTIYTYTAMPTLSPAALTPATLYYIYLTDILSIPTLEASATGYTVDTVGRAYKTGDVTRRLMGIAYVVTGPAWANTSTQRLVRSHAHRDRESLGMVNYFGDNRSTASATFVELGLTTERIEWLQWANESILIGMSGIGYNNTPGAAVRFNIAVNSGSATDAYSGFDAIATGPYMPFSASAAYLPGADGHYNAEIMAQTSSGTVVASGSSGSTVHTSIVGQIR